MTDGSRAPTHASDADLFRRANVLLDAALDRAPAERDALVASSCGEDVELHAAVVRLLRAYDAAPDAFLGRTGAVFAAPLLAPPSLFAGALIGQHRLVKPLGEGGMGTVWLARDESLGRDVALKVVRGASHGSDPSAPRARAAREARVVAQLDHPHIATIHEAGETSDGLLWFSMPYCAGGSLADRIRAEVRLPVPDVLRIARQLVSALAAAHSQRLVHRDVKPANVLFDTAGHVRLADFGIAMVADAENTRESDLVGTVSYLAPEQVAGATVDHRADLWALGVTLYEMLTGARPFDAPGHSAVLQAIVTHRPASIPPSCGAPPALEDLIGRLLQKRPEDRPESAARVESILAAIADGRGAAQVSFRRQVASRTMFATALVATAALVVATIWPRFAAAPRTDRLAATGTTNVQAQQEYLQARYERLKRTPESLALSVTHYERAVALDPGFARAWAGLANTLVTQGVFGNAPMATLLPRARATATRAIAMDSTLAEAQAALAHLLRVYDFDWEGSLRVARRAATLDAEEESVALQHAITLTHLRRFAEAESVVTSALRVDPINGSLEVTLGRVQLASGRSVDAITTLQRVVSLQPEFHFGWEQLGYAQLAAGRRTEALASMRRAAVLSGARDSAHLAHMLAVTGSRDEARRIVASLTMSTTTRYLQPVPMAAAYAGLGDADRAFDWLERSWRERAPTLDAAAVMPSLAALHGDARWRPFLRRLGLPAD